jgi:hypothetical protein
MIRRSVHSGSARLFVGELNAAEQPAAARRERGAAPEPERIGEQAHRMPEQLLQVRLRLLELHAPVVVAVLRHRLVVPRVGADRHARAVEPADLPARQPARLAEHDGHDEERRPEVISAQDGERLRVLAHRRVVEGQQHRLFW